LSVIQFKETLDNGIMVLGEQNPDAFSSAFALLMPLGAKHDPVNQFGLSAVTQEVLYKGAGPWDTQALAAQIDHIGFQEGHRTERETSSFSGTTLPKHLFRALDITHTVLTEPKLPEIGLEEVRQLAMHQLMAMEDAPAQKMFYELGQRFFPKPLSNPAEGTLETLQAIKLDDVRQNWQQYTPQNALISVAGKFDKDKLIDHLQQRFGKWQGGTLPQVEDSEASIHVEHVEKDTEQMQIGIAYDSIPITHPDYYKARMGVMALSGGMSSRLFVEVRQKRGLAYSVFATYLSTKNMGGVLGYAGTTTERAQETLDVLLEELRRIEHGITQDEFDKAKTKLKTNFIVQGESNRARAEGMVREYYYREKVWRLDEAMAMVDALTLDEINAYLKTSVPEKFTVLTLGKTPLEVNA